MYQVPLSEKACQVVGISIYIHFGSYCTFLSMHMHFILPCLTNTYIYIKIGGHNLVYKMWILYRTQLEKKNNYTFFRLLSFYVSNVLV